MNERLILIQIALKEAVQETGFGCNSCGKSFGEQKVHMVVFNPSVDGSEAVQGFFKCAPCVEKDGGFSDPSLLEENTANNV